MVIFLCREQNEFYYFIYFCGSIQSCRFIRIFTYTDNWLNQVRQWLNSAQMLKHPAWTRKYEEKNATSNSTHNPILISIYISSNEAILFKSKRQTVRLSIYPSVRFGDYVVISALQTLVAITFSPLIFLKYGVVS